jgi:hypothetical protein
MLDAYYTNQSIISTYDSNPVTINRRINLLIRLRGWVQDLDVSLGICCCCAGHAGFVLLIVATSKFYVWWCLGNFDRVSVARG